MKKLILITIIFLLLITLAWLLLPTDRGVVLQNPFRVHSSPSPTPSPTPRPTPSPLDHSTNLKGEIDRLTPTNYDTLFQSLHNQTTTF